MSMFLQFIFYATQHPLIIESRKDSPIELPRDYSSLPGRRGEFMVESSTL